MKRSVLLFIVLLFAVMSGAAGAASTESRDINITADNLQYFAETGRYEATGHVVAVRQGATITSEEMTYYERSSELSARTKVRYEDAETVITAAKADLNLDRKTGKLYEAVVFYKKSHSYIAGKELDKVSENEYHGDSAAFTTCDAPVPDWCFRGKDVTAFPREKIVARDVSFRIKDVPVLYAPYFWGSLSGERQTGFLIPVAGYSKTNGAEFNLPFYWSIAENRDATIVVDAFSKRGIGTGLEYRFIEPDSRRGNLWIYHIRDTSADKDFVEAKALYEARRADGIGGYLNFDYVNEKDYYRLYSVRRDMRTQRYLESTAEVSTPSSDSRAYALAQYWVDLKNETRNVPQRLPEIGYTLNYVNVGGVMVAVSANAANLWRESGITAERFDIYPKARYAVGSDVVFSQGVGLRATGYAFSGEGSTDRDKMRAAFEYDAVLHTRLSKNYGSLMHVIEPSLGYHFIASSENSLPVFDSAEQFGMTSVVSLSLLNRGITKEGEIFKVRLEQFIDTRSGDRPFQPIHLSAAFTKPVSLAFDATFDYYAGRVDTVTAGIGFKLFRTDFLFGERYNRKDNTLLYAATAAFSPAAAVNMSVQAWYDAKGPGLTDLSFHLKYQKQCWAMRVEAVKRPGDFSMKVFFELAGLNAKVTRKESPADDRTYF